MKNYLKNTVHDHARTLIYKHIIFYQAWLGINKFKIITQLTQNVVLK